MLDQLKIDGLFSLDDFDASLKSRHISAPDKKSIRETVPHSNAIYDFSDINGEVYWSERELEYVFEIIAESPEELERKKTAFSNWVMFVPANGYIYDPYDPDWYYTGAFESIDYDDDESMEKTTVTVVFCVEPYKKAKEPIFSEKADESLVFYLEANSTVEETFSNPSSHPVRVLIFTDVPLTVTLNGKGFSIPIGFTESDSIRARIGKNTIKFANNSANRAEIGWAIIPEVL